MPAGKDLTEVAAEVGGDDELQSMLQAMVTTQAHQQHI
jgi:hypothetical protein